MTDALRQIHLSGGPLDGAAGTVPAYYSVCQTVWVRDKADGVGWEIVDYAGFPRTVKYLRAGEVDGVTRFLYWTPTRDRSDVLENQESSNR